MTKTNDQGRFSKQTRSRSLKSPNYNELHAVFALIVSSFNATVGDLSAQDMTPYGYLSIELLSSVKLGMRCFIIFC